MKNDSLASHFLNILVLIGQQNRKAMCHLRASLRVGGVEGGGTPCPPLIRANPCGSIASTLFLGTPEGLQQEERQARSSSPQRGASPPSSQTCQYCLRCHKDENLASASGAGGGSSLRPPLEHPLGQADEIINL